MYALGLLKVIGSINTSLTKQLLFNTNDASKRGPTSSLETTVLKNTNYSRDEFYRKALKREL